MIKHFDDEDGDENVNVNVSTSLNQESCPVVTAPYNDIYERAPNYNIKQRDDLFFSIAIFFFC